MLDTRYQKLKDYTNKIYMESEAIDKRFTGNIPKDYKNPHLENDRIFTKEEIDKMPRTEYQKNEKAIRYQRKTIGIPTKSQAEKNSLKEGKRDGACFGIYDIRRPQGRGLFQVLSQRVAFFLVKLKVFYVINDLCMDV